VKIAIDLQACQSPGSRQRGIGRYSLELARALVRNRGEHRLHFLLNAAFDDVEASLRETLAPNAEATFEQYQLVHLEGTQGLRRRALQRVNDEILNWRYACADAEALHVSSVFEGWFDGEEHVSGRLADVPAALKSATLYDLIPLLFPDRHLPRASRPDYLARVGLFHQCDVIFAISESARADAMRLLGIPAERIVNIRAASGPTFSSRSYISPGERAALLARHGMAQRFILYSGGNDPRKNVDFLLRAYAGLPPEVRAQVQLAVVCALHAEERLVLERRIAELGVTQQVILTGFVPDTELDLLYNVCDLFVFPSLYEGFGLPVLEAMSCGACVIASSTSSMPEIVGCSDALFDPTDLAELTRLIQGLLAAPDRRRELAEHGLARSREFSWDKVAQTMLGALEEAHARRATVPRSMAIQGRPRVALFAPLPPQPTPVAGYVASMLPHWSRHFDLVLVAAASTPKLEKVHGRYPVIDVADLRRDRNRYDTVLYAIGDSAFHADMYELLSEIPGIALMLDGSLASLVDWMESSGRQPGILMRELRSMNGEAARRDLRAAERGDLSVEALVARHPLARQVLLNARGLILHWQCAERMLRNAYPDAAGVPSVVVPPAVFDAVDAAERSAARSAIGLTADRLLIASFGTLDETQRSHVLLAALADGRLVADRRLRVAFVGNLPQSSYRTRILDLLERHPLREQIEITGTVDATAYGHYRAACDVAVQLESVSRGTSPAVIHALLAAGCPTIVAADGPLNEWPEGVTPRVNASDWAALAAVLRGLAADAGARDRLSTAARDWVARACHPARVAERHAAAIALLPTLDEARCAQQLVRRVAECIADAELDHEVTLDASDAIASGLALHPASARRLGEPL